MSKITTSGQILKTYLALTMLSTLASSFIWGINTLFLLDAGLSITQAFAANAFFTLGQVVFEIPTGVVADTVGRRRSFLLGSATLFASTLLYLLMWYIHGPFWAWALASVLLGLGFTFFSGATEAWLVDGLTATNYSGTLEAAFARGQIAAGAAMLSGAIAGGVVAQATNLGVPYIMRAVLLGFTFLVAFLLMRDIGFAPSRRTSLSKEMRGILRDSFNYGLRNPPVRWIMLASPFSAGVGIYAFYAMQPYLLGLYGQRESYAIAGLAAAIVAGAQIIGGVIAPFVGKVFRHRTSFLICGAIANAFTLLALGLSTNFWIALLLLASWAIIAAATMPIRQSFLNALIPSAQRATVLSSDNLLSSVGGVVIQPGLGKVADVWSYSTSYLVGAGIDLLAVPFLLLARRERAVADLLHSETAESVAGASDRGPSDA
ncbi:MAG: MFS transporter [Chloroflexales bacterium]|nr:MFS transporter [Chloroflexales bacterium]